MLLVSYLEFMHVYVNIYVPAQANVKVDDVCPVIADWNVFCVSKQSTVTGQQVPQSVTHFLPPSLPLSLSPGTGQLACLGEW